MELDPRLKSGMTSKKRNTRRYPAGVVYETKEQKVLRVVVVEALEHRVDGLVGIKIRFAAFDHLAMFVQDDASAGRQVVLFESSRSVIVEVHEVARRIGTPLHARVVFDVLGNVQMRHGFSSSVVNHNRSILYGRL